MRGDRSPIVTFFGDRSIRFAWRPALRRQDSFGTLAISGCDVSGLLDPVQQSLKEVPLPIDPAGEHEGAFTVCLRRDVGPDLSLGRLGPNGIADVPLVGPQDVSVAELVRQRAASRSRRSARQSYEGRRATFGVDQRVNLFVSPPRESPMPQLSPAPFPWPHAGEHRHRSSRS